jgi:hypothetical protein
MIYFAQINLGSYFPTQLSQPYNLPQDKKQKPKTKKTYVQQ